MKDQHTLIDNYVQNLLSDEDKASFKLEMAKNEVLQEEVYFRKAIVHHFKLEQIKQTIKKARIENEQEQKVETKLQTVRDTIAQAKTENIQNRQRRMRLYKSIALAAVFISFIGVGWFSNISSKDDRLVKIIIKESDIENVAAYNVDDITRLVEKANNAIDEGNYDSVLSITDQLRNDEEFETDEILQNECYIYFDRGEYKTANRKIDKIINEDKANEVRRKISALYLKIGEKDYATEQLKNISSGSYLD